MKDTTLKHLWPFKVALLKTLKELGIEDIPPQEQIRIIKERLFLDDASAMENIPKVEFGQVVTRLIDLNLDVWYSSDDGLNIRLFYNKQKVSKTVLKNLLADVGCKNITMNGWSGYIDFILPSALEEATLIA